MSFAPDHDPYYARLRQCELIDAADRARLVRQAARAQGHPSLRWRFGHWLVAAGEVLQAAPAGETCAEPC